MWQLVAYMVLTAAEVMVSITCLEFSYTQAPKRMKSFVMGLLLLSVSGGNLFAAGVNWFIHQSKEGGLFYGAGIDLSGANYYWFFSGTVLLVTLGYVVVSQFYRGETVIQDSDE